MFCEKMVEGQVIHISKCVLNFISYRRFLGPQFDLILGLVLGHLALGDLLLQKYYKAGSTIELQCVISKIPHPSSYITWRHGLRLLNYDTSRGGIRWDILSI